MAKDIAFENEVFPDFKVSWVMTLTSDRVTLHTVVHHSSNSTYMPNVIEIEEQYKYRHTVVTNYIDIIW